MATEDSTPTEGEQKSTEATPAETAAPAATATAAAPAKKSGSALAVIAIVLAALAAILALIPFVVFVAPVVGLAALIISIIALVKKSGHVAVRIIALVLAVIAAPLAAIGIIGTVALVPPTLDGKAVSSEVEAIIADNYSMGSTVECADEMSGWPGDTFECSVTAQSGNTGSVLITMEEGGEWSVNIDNPDFLTFLSQDEVQDYVAEDIWYDYEVSVAVTCPEEMVGGVDTVFICEVTDGVNVGEVEVKITGGTSEDWVWRSLD